MHYVHHDQHDDFLLLRASLPAAEAGELLAEGQVSHVIVHRAGQTPRYYLYTVDEALPALRAAPAGATVAGALHLDARQPAPVVDPFAGGDSVRDRAVVLDGTHVTGYVDWDAPIPKGPVGPGAPGSSFPSTPMASFAGSTGRNSGQRVPKRQWVLCFRRYRSARSLLALDNIPQ